MLSISTTRFNNETWDENYKWREKNKCAGCAYGLMKPISEEIGLNTYMIVLEMNNDKNKIMGFGFIQNMTNPKHNIKIYSKQKFCYYTYHSPYRIDRNELLSRENIIIEILEVLVFYGKGHLKRGQGITRISDAMLLRGKMDFKHELMIILTNKYPVLKNIRI